MSFRLVDGAGWHGAGSDKIAFAALWIGSLGSLLKFFGLAVCVPLAALGIAAIAPWRARSAPSNPLP